MKFKRNCGLSFLAFSRIVCLMEMLFSGIVGALCVMSWIKEGKPTSFLYEHNPKDANTVRNKSLEDCIVIWCLAILMSVCIWRVISAVILFFSVQRDSVGMAQYWMMFKLVAVTITGFVAITSFTAPAVKITAMISLVADLITSYFMFILFPELDRMAKVIRITTKGKKEPISE